MDLPDLVNLKVSSPTASNDDGCQSPCVITTTTSITKDEIVASHSWKLVALSVRVSRATVSDAGSLTPTLTWPGFYAKCHM